MKNIFCQPILVKNQCHWSTIGAGFSVIRLVNQSLLIFNNEKTHTYYFQLSFLSNNVVANDLSVEKFQSGYLKMVILNM